jgi:hypothetical protein
MMKIYISSSLDVKLVMLVRKGSQESTASVALTTAVDYNLLSDYFSQPVLTRTSNE